VDERGSFIMGAYKGPGKHRLCYKTDCQCKANFFVNSRDAILHAIKCNVSTCVFYVPQVGENKKIWDK
jgi:hypothetical protein